MDHIALIADIHGNIPALHAAAEDIKARGIKKIYCLGDMCGRGPNGAYVIDWCRKHCECILMGNWEDFFIKAPHTSKAKKYIHELGDERFQFLHTLPFTKAFWISGRRMHLFHGRPIYPVLSADAPLSEKGKMFSAVTDEFIPDIVGYADIHVQLKIDFPDESKTLFNTGSIGNSFCSPTACYVIVHGDLDQRELQPFSIEFVSVPYDLEAAVKNAKAASAWFDTENYIQEIMTASWQNIQ